MAEHPIVPIEPDQLPLPKKRQTRKPKVNNSLVLNVKTQKVEFNFYKGINHQVIEQVVGRVLDEND